jgi:hypothetical protein
VEKMLAPVVEIFCDIDDYCQRYFTAMNCRLLPNPQRQRNKGCRLHLSEIMTLVVLFHLSHYRTFKDYYNDCVLKDLKVYFPRVVSYNRFVELMQTALLPLSAYLKAKAGERTGLYYVDASALPVCHNKRIHRHKVFKDLASRGKTTMGWFYGFKLHLVINTKGEVMSFCLTPGHIDDRAPLEKLFKGLKGLAFGDRGYISKEKYQRLLQKGLCLVTRIKKNMKQKPMTALQSFFLSKRGLVETVIDQLKALCHIQHTRHRSPTNFLVNLVSGLVAYVLRPRKPSVKWPLKLPYAHPLMSS